MLSLDIAATGMLAQQMNVDTISNNIANMTTTGFKRQRAQFQDLMYQNKTRPGITSSSVGTVLPSGIQVGLGVKPGSIYRINEQGPMSITGNTYDMAIAGRGYFQISMPDGSIGYSRDGSFSLNGDGEIVNLDGYPRGTGHHRSGGRDPGRHLLKTAWYQVKVPGHRLATQQTRPDPDRGLPERRGS